MSKSIVGKLIQIVRIVSYPGTAERKPRTYPVSGDPQMIGRIVQIADTLPEMIREVRRTSHESALLVLTDHAPSVFEVTDAILARMKSDQEVTP